MIAAEQIPVTHPEAAIAALKKMLDSDSHTLAARRFAQKYHDYDPRLANEHLLDDIEDLLDRCTDRIPLTVSEHPANLPAMETRRPVPDAACARST
jgi:hypothetical protein